MPQALCQWLALHAHRMVLCPVKNPKPNRVSLDSYLKRLILIMDVVAAFGKGVGVLAAHLVGIVEGCARAENLHKRESFVLYRLHQNVRQNCGLCAEASGNKRCPEGYGKNRRVERNLGWAFRSGFGDLCLMRCGRCLSLGQPIDKVVHHNIGDIKIAAAGVRKMRRANGQPIAISTHNHNIQVRVAYLNAHSRGKRPAMDPVVSIAVDEVRRPR